MARLWFAGVPSGTGKPEESTGRTGFAGWLSGAETAKNSLPGLADRPVMEQAGNGLTKRTESVCGPDGFFRIVIPSLSRKQYRTGGCYKALQISGVKAAFC